jgi:hypothetical protein
MRAPRRARLQPKMCALCALATMFVVSSSPLAGASSVRDRTAAVNALSETFPVHIFYYAWFGAPGYYDGGPTRYREWDHEVLPHWDEREAGKHSSGALHQPPEDIAAAFFPARGLYSSLDRETQRRQMQEIADSKVDVVVFSWWRNMSHSDVQGRKGLFPGTDGAAMGALDGALAAGIKICFHLEPYNGRVRTAFSVLYPCLALAPCKAHAHPCITSFALPAPASALALLGAYRRSRTCATMWRSSSRNTVRMLPCCGSRICPSSTSTTRTTCPSTAGSKSCYRGASTP